MERSSFCMWGERGLIGTFFADMHMWASASDWQNFLGGVSILDARFPRYIAAVRTVVEPDFGNKGFGHPDGVLLLEGDNGKFVAIIEAKRKSFAKSCGKARGQGYYNSTLKGQLELNHLLAAALSKYEGGNAPLVEPDWVVRTPYMLGRRPGHRATLKNKIVLRSVVRELSGLPLEDYFHIVITTDLENPFENASNCGVFPEIYESAAPSENVWSSARRRYGWLNYGHLSGLSKRLDRTKKPFHAGLFEDSYEINLPNMSATIDVPIGARTKKSVIVYLPEFSPHTLLHCSYQRDKCKLRDYSQSSTTEPVPNESLTRSEVLAKASITIAAQAVPYTNVGFWHDEIRRFNAQLINERQVRESTSKPT